MPLQMAPGHVTTCMGVSLHRGLLFIMFAELLPSTVVGHFVLGNSLALGLNSENLHLGSIDNSRKYHHTCA
jgi:hypothetical protein